ncbi:hypothetical protein PF005_g31009 [Phytophthora fragariae]|uniref:Uncharacterized protein n=1 Tax=Phytophthora fragariae TaxID=53985 RepID=A0A6A3V8L1_9STRA|nr:hypothetical protein PF003_g22837 [Phytophthora fragariae]KAE8931457.1 hypothetical protein PF009_g18481 [Phytophthora fragariae]KAE8966425.1 hypothetical protein PF011_g27942 [Phytophthora fragariae]KAE9058794.1 hypothetical protein PF010_g30870 [Phytophthora fragariae]KAE9061355.1 hypothetical protein PF007_g30282 [Phytophthora fragariae]
MADHYHAAKEGSKRYENVPENTYAIAFDDNKILNTGILMEVRQRLVFRRFFENERIVFTWKFISEAQECFSGMHQEEVGWCWAYPSTETTEPGTVVTICIRKGPMSYTSSASEATRDEFGQLLQNDEKETWETMMSSLNKLLLDNVLAGVGF